ncbi:MAG: TIGR00730 family Rossman fold protein [Muribaculaceae bacterium]
MKVIIENHIPYISRLVEPFADEVLYLADAEITPEAVADADVLLVRTRTRCDAGLLDSSRCRFIGTATIGTDHIDLDYCESRGITVANAPGCNAPAVAQYVLATIARWMEKEHIDASDSASLTLGVVGVGHVGSIVARWARDLGFKVLLCDPPRARREGSDAFVGIDEIARRADIITFHTPFTREGDDATFHLCDEGLIGSMRHCRLLINSARGGIVDNAALLAALEDGRIGDAAIDCWENEPNIDLRLLDRAFVATPHIAGYSAEGKRRATAMIVEALNRRFGWSIEVPAVDAPTRGVAHVTLPKIAASYDPLADTDALRGSAEGAAGFEALRNGYKLRHEVGEYRVCVFGASSDRIDRSFKDAAYRLGILLAQSGIAGITGAGREGMMRAVTDGFLDVGGNVIGIIPQFMVDNGWQYDRLSGIIATPGMAERKSLMLAMSDDIVVLPGGCGTLDELFEAITAKQLGLFGGRIVLLNTGGFFNPAMEMLQRCIASGFMRPSHANLWTTAATPEEALDAILARAATPHIESKY